MPGWKKAVRQIQMMRVLASPTGAPSDESTFEQRAAEEAADDALASAIREDVLKRSTELLSRTVEEDTYEGETVELLKRELQELVAMAAAAEKDLAEMRKKCESLPRLQQEVQDVQQQCKALVQEKEDNDGRFERVQQQSEAAVEKVKHELNAQKRGFLEMQEHTAELSTQVELLKDECYTVGKNHAKALAEVERVQGHLVAEKKRADALEAQNTQLRNRPDAPPPPVPLDLPAAPAQAAPPARRPAPQPVVVKRPPPRPRRPPPPPPKRKIRKRRLSVRPVPARKRVYYKDDVPQPRVLPKIVDETDAECVFYRLHQMASEKLASCNAATARYYLARMQHFLDLQEVYVFDDADGADEPAAAASTAVDIVRRLKAPPAADAALPVVTTPVSPTGETAFSTATAPGALQTATGMPLCDGSHGEITATPLTLPA
eukprot:TRINITY_DN16908_c0_g1_i1.p1 TRINITY_DN16908_c0_g1~~TRINITY_DN16908_c0_g1_i1.p1  ORF type:complete len:433 (+),score=203.11 TRINITY_DN16908_c0_g1_i1:71-1369(+)